MERQIVDGKKVYLAEDHGIYQHLNYDNMIYIAFPDNMLIWLDSMSFMMNVSRPELIRLAVDEYMRIKP